MILKSLRIGAVLTLMTLSACGTMTGQKQSWPAQPRGGSPQTEPLPPAGETGAARPLENLPGQVPNQLPSNVPRSAEEGSGAAVRALIEQAREASAAGHQEQAIATLERAQRIEPRNPFVWQNLAAVHFAAGNFDLADATAQKANSLARGNPYVEVETWKIIYGVCRARGDMPGAAQAQARLEALYALFGQ